MHAILVLLALVATLPKSQSQIMAPYKQLIIENAVPCEDKEGKNVTFEWHPKTDPDGVVRAYGYWDTAAEIGGNMEVIFTFSMWATTSWKKLFVFSNKDVCAGLDKTIPDVIELLMKSCGRTRFDCPIRAGRYNIQAFPLTIPPLKNFPNFFIGKYKFRMAFKDKGSKYGCFEVILTVLPKDKKKI